jgi:hypothetical protein
VWRRRRGHGPEFASCCAVEGVELAIHRSDQDDIEDLERVVVCCGISTRGEEVQAADAVFPSTAVIAVTTDRDRLGDGGDYQNDKEGEEQKRRVKKECR